MARPPKADTVQFRRKLDNPKLQILLSAGEGNISQGFENVLAIYQHVHSQGYRAEHPVEIIGLVTNSSETTNSPNVEDLLREGIGNV